MQENKSLKNLWLKKSTKRNWTIIRTQEDQDKNYSQRMGGESLKKPRKFSIGKDELTRWTRKGKKMGWGIGNREERKKDFKDIQEKKKEE